ncbi:hypothetical protein [Bacteroides cellulosilyticus]|nr:hypothetical protein [Bacteroides cellulosilyticus]
MSCPQSPAANRPNVSCPVGKDGGRAKEAPVEIGVCRACHDSG